MRKSITLSVIGLASLFCGPTQAQETLVVGAPLVTVVGFQDPKFSVEINPDDLKKVADGLKGLDTLDPQDLSINDLMSEDDLPAVKGAAQRISDIFVECAKNLIDLRVLVYRLAAVTSASVNTKDNSDSLIKTYQQKFEADYRSIVGNFNQIDRTLLAQILACKSELCAVQVSNAQIELLQFAKEISHGIDLRKGKVMGSKLVVKSPLVAKVLALTYEALRTGGSDYATLLAAELSPFVAASQDSSTFGNKMNDLILLSPGSPGSSEQVTSSSPLYAQKVRTHVRLFTRAVKAVVRRKILSIENHLPLDSPDLNKLSGTHSRLLSLITCSRANEGGISWIAVGFARTGTEIPDDEVSSDLNFPNTRRCTDLLSGDTYNESDHGFGVGAGIGVGAPEMFLIFSPIPLNNKDLSGTWRGLEFSFDPILGASAGVFVGPRASILVRLGADAGMGAVLDAAAIKLRRVQGAAK